MADAKAREEAIQKARQQVRAGGVFRRANVASKVAPVATVARAGADGPKKPR